MDNHSKFAGIIVVILLVIYFLFRFSSNNQSTYTIAEIDNSDVEKQNQEFISGYKEHVSEVKSFPGEMCDNSDSEDCKWAIDTCFRTQECQNMVIAYQISIKGTIELNREAFIKASKIYINEERVKLGLPPVR